MENGVFVAGVLVGVPVPQVSAKNGQTYYTVQVNAGEVVDVGVDGATYEALKGQLYKPVTLRVAVTDYGLKRGSVVPAAAPQLARAG